MRAVLRALADAYEAAVMILIAVSLIMCAVTCCSAAL